MFPFGLCGGCTYLSLPYEEQLKVKEEQVKRLLDSVLNKQEEAWIFEGIKGSPKAYEYRNKMEFSFGDEYKDGPLALGMHKRGSFYDIVTVADCEIVDADYRLILQSVRDYFARAKVSFFHRMSHEGYLRHLLVRKASRTGEILVALVTTSQDPWQGETAVEGSLDADALITGFKDLLLSLEQDGKLVGKFAGILHITNDSIADVVQSDHTELLYGQEYFYEELLGLKFKISTFSFFRPTPTVRRYCTRRREIMWATWVAATRPCSTSTAAPAPSRSSWHRPPGKSSVWRSWRKPWRQQRKTPPPTDWIIANSLPEMY